MGSRHPAILMYESGGWGGLAHYAYNLCEALARSGCDVTLLTRGPFELEALPRTFEVVAPATSRSWWRRAAALCRAVGRERPDLLHLQSAISARRDWLLLWWIRLRGTPLVVTAHNVLPHDRAERQAPGMRWAFGRIYAAADRIIVHSAKIRRRLLETFPSLDSRKVVVIAHGDYGFVTETPDLSPADARRRLGLAPDARLVLSFGAIREYKGIPDLIEAFGLVADELPRVRLAIVGAPIGVDPAELEAKVRAHGIEDRVVLRPEYVPIEEVGIWLAATDLAVYPYRAIDQSGALQLAYGCGKPVVVTAVGALAETVRDGFNGRVVAPRDPGALAAAIRELMELPDDELEEMGRRSKAIADEEHDWTEIAATTRDLYLEVCDTPSDSVPHARER